jgi:hypothetical protein
MGELLAAFRRLPTETLRLDDLWTDPARLGARAKGWAAAGPDLDASERTALAHLLDRVPALFDRRPAC